MSITTHSKRERRRERETKWQFWQLTTSMVPDFLLVDKSGRIVKKYLMISHHQNAKNSFNRRMNVSMTV
jgi:hypothetical protein